MNQIISLILGVDSDAIISHDRQGVVAYSSTKAVQVAQKAKLAGFNVSFHNGQTIEVIYP